MKKAQFVTSFRYLELEGDVESFQLMPGINISNSVNIKKNLLTPTLLEGIGKIEFDFLELAPNIVFFDYDENAFATLGANDTNADALLVAILVWIDNLFRNAWLIKDHAIECDFAFLTIHTNTGKTQWFSNYLASRPSFSDGTRRKSIKMTIDEMGEWAKINANIETYLYEKNSSSLQFMLDEKVKRIGRAMKFISAARISPNLAFRLAHYCSALETLFATDTSELSHRLSERTAFFLGSLGYDKLEVFRNIKKAYTVRSKLTHGANLDKKGVDELPQISVIIDDYLRKITTAILVNKNLQSIFESNSTRIDEYFNKLIFSETPKTG